MVTALISTGLVGALGCAILLWRWAITRGERDKARAEVEKFSADLYACRVGTDTLTRRLNAANEATSIVEGQRDDALRQLAETSKPGVVADVLRHALFPHLGPTDKPGPK